MSELDDILKQGLALHQKGLLNDAARIYEQVLTRQPNHFDALHLLGTAALQSRQTEYGVELVRKAIKLNGAVASAHVTLGNGLRDLGLFEEAVVSFDTAVALTPDYARAWYNRGNALLELHRPDQAAESYDKAITLGPDNAEAHSGRGNALCALSRPAAAIPSFDRAIALKSTFAEAWYNRGNALLQLRRFNEALESYDRAIISKPNLAEAFDGRGNALWELKRPEAALSSYDKALALRPDYVDALSNRANALRDLKQFGEALASCEMALALRPTHAPAHHNRGNALVDLKRPKDAVASYNQAITLKPDYARAYFNRGNVLVELANIEQAIIDFDRSIALEPNYAPAHCNRGSALVAQLRLDEAAAEFHTAITLQPDYVEAHWNDGLRLLLSGQFEQGWRGYECRKQLNEPVGARSYPQPLWLGEPDIDGKTLFLHWEQGFGDTIQFCRFAKLAEARGATVIMEVQRALVGLLEQLSPTIQLITPDKRPASFDYHCPLMSLPLAFGTTLETIPREPDYLRADTGLRAKWSNHLEAVAHGPMKKPRIGIAWRGNSAHHHDHLRSVDLPSCLPLFAREADWVCLQKEIQKDDLHARDSADRLLFFGDELADFNDTAALVDLMDLVISVDTGVAHLAGAMGKPTWLMLPYSPDWRWMLNRDDSPWYPSVKLFRQSTVGDWSGVINQITRALDKTRW